MKAKFFKFSKQSNNKLITANDLKNINVNCNVVHSGRVLTTDDIKNNRSSKYTFISFSI